MHCMQSAVNLTKWYDIWSYRSRVKVLSLSGRNNWSCRLINQFRRMPPPFSSSNFRSSVVCRAFISLMKNGFNISFLNGDLHNSQLNKNKHVGLTTRSGECISRLKWENGVKWSFKLFGAFKKPFDLLVPINIHRIHWISERHFYLIFSCRALTFV